MIKHKKAKIIIAPSLKNQTKLADNQIKCKKNPKLGSFFIAFDNRIKNK